MSRACTPLFMPLRDTSSLRSWVSCAGLKEMSISMNLAASYSLCGEVISGRSGEAQRKAPAEVLLQAEPLGVVEA